MNLFETLNTLGSRINHWYPYINNGGCCVFASIIGKELYSRGIETRIVIGAEIAAKKDINKLRKKVSSNSLDDWATVGIFFNHVAVEFRWEGVWYIYDTDGVNPRGPKIGAFTLYPGFISHEDAAMLASEKYGWNCEFDRRKIPSLKRHIRRYLSTTLPA